VLCLRDSWSGRLLANPAPLTGPGQSVCYAPEARFLVTGGIETTPTRAWNAVNGKLLGQFSDSAGGSIWSAQFSPDGKFFATAYADAGTNGGVRIYTIETAPAEKKGCGLSPNEINSFPGSCWSLNFDRDSHRLAFADQ